MRSASAAILSGLGVLAIFSLWLRYPIHLSIAIGAVFAVVFLMAAASIGHDPEEADAAWRSAAPDLAGRPEIRERRPSERSYGRPHESD